MKEITVNPADSAESRADANHGIQTILEMSRIKNGNPVYLGIQKNKVRDFFGLKQNERAVHVYSDKTNSGKPSLFDIIQSLYASRFKNRLKIIFISSTFGSESIESLALRATLGEAKVLKLSQLSEGDLRRLIDKSNDLIIVENDITGFKPYIDSVSDLAIIKGPINHAEAIAVGTPVLSLCTDVNLQNYNKPSFFKMLEPLEKIGGLFKLTDSRELSDSIGSALSRQVTIDRSKIFGSSDTVKTPLDRVLIDLSRFIRLHHRHGHGHEQNIRK